MIRMEFKLSLCVKYTNFEVVAIKKCFYLMNVR